MAHQFGVTIEQKLSKYMIFSVSYAGTRGRDLLRFTTPNLGQDSILVPLAAEVFGPSTALQPSLFGLALPPVADAFARAHASDPSIEPLAGLDDVRAALDARQALRT